MGRRADSDAEATRTQIIDESFCLFGQFGFDAVSVGQLSQAAGLSKSALYWHFGNKAELFIACLERLDAIFAEHVFTPVEQESDPAVRVLTFFRGLNNLLLDTAVTRGIGGYWLDPHGASAEAIAAVQAKHEAARVRLTAETFRLGQERAQFRFTADPDDMARALIAVMEAVILPLRRHTPEENIRALQFLMETFFKAYGGDLSEQLGA